MASILFLCAIVHTFMAGKFTAVSHRRRVEHDRRIESGEARPGSVDILGEVCHFLGEVEVVFGLWAMPLIVAIVVFTDWPTAVGYIDHGVNLTEPAFVVVIMVLASTRPILLLAESIMLRLAALVGGTLTHFAAPPVLMVAGPWGWGTEFMLTQFGWKAVIGILCSNGLYFWVFRKELARMQEGSALRSLKEEIGRRFVTRELIEREWAAAEVETKKELDLFDSVDGATREFVAKVRQRLEAKVCPGSSGRSSRTQTGTDGRTQFRCGSQRST